MTEDEVKRLQEIKKWRSYKNMLWIDENIDFLLGLVERLQKQVDEAPHQKGCGSHGHPEIMTCDCWKAGI